MALQTSGPIAISSIAAEIGVSNYSLRYLSSLAGFSTPDAMSEFYGYSAAEPTIYFDGQMIFSYTAPTPTNAFLYAINYQPNVQSIVDIPGSGNFDISTDYTPWDRYMLDHGAGATTENNIFIYSNADTSNVGADYVSIYITPPSYRSFSGISVSGGTPPASNYSFTVVSYDYSAANIFASYYGNGSYSYAYHDVFFSVV
jgi:hypothetical protein